MITTFLIEHPWLSPVALATLVVLGPIGGRVLARRQRAAWVLTAVALPPVLALTLLPTPRPVRQRCEVAWTLPTVGRVELAANVVLLVAPALLATVATRRPLLVAVAGSALAAAIETVQASVPALGRSCSTDDWLANTIGVLIGVVLARIGVGAWRGASGPDTSDRTHGKLPDKCHGSGNPAGDGRRR